MCPPIKPIETVYKGYRFRSRLEARWAVFFDRFGVAYQYESEGFDLGNGTAYLPDFWLPKVAVLFGARPRDLYFEVKPKTDLPPSITEKIVTFSADTNDGIVVCFGDPWIETRLAYLGGGGTYFCSDCKFGVWKEGTSEQRGIVLEQVVRVMFEGSPSYDVDAMIQEVTKEGGVMAAYQVARSTRFEYG